MSTLEKNKEVDLECAKCHMLKFENEKLKEEAFKLTKFEKSTHCLNEMLSNQKPSGDKLGLGFNSFEASSSGTKEIKFVKAQKQAFSDGGPINMGGPLSMLAAPKAIMKPPPVVTPGSKKSVSFQKSIFGPRPKRIIVNNVKVPVASDNEICRGLDLEPDEWIKDSGCSKHMTGNRKLFSSYKAYNGGIVIFVAILAVTSLAKLPSICHVSLCDWPAVKSTSYSRKVNLVQPPSRTSYLQLMCQRRRHVAASHWPAAMTWYAMWQVNGRSIPVNATEPLVNGGSYSQNSKAYIILNKHTRKVEESLNVTFDETPPPSKTSPLVDDDLDEEEAVKVTEKKNLKIDIVDETLEINEIVNIKESRNHPLENVIGNLNQRTLKSQAQNQSNFFCIISTIEPKNVNEDLTDDSWIVAMQEELNQFIANDVWELVPQPRNMTIIGTKWVFRNKLDENDIVSQNKARILLAYACALDFKLFQMDVKSAFLNGFINEEVYVAQPPGFIDFEKPDHVYKLKKALYGLKQAPKA
ncbi:retrovirus-related pol polyprotein from transposon TNT 1-94, partial [Tanacetum coccineum]